MRQVAVNAVYELAKRDPRVVFIGSDLGPGVLEKMKTEMPERFFMEGVSEAHVIGMAAGLAMEGYVPYINTIATFLTRRCYEQIAIDVCLHRLPVRLIASGGGVVYAPLGPTHMATDDLALMRSLPHMTAVAPVDADEMRRLMDASLAYDGPLYIRLAKGGDPIVSRGDVPFNIGEAIRMRGGDDVLMVSTGVMTTRALEAAKLLENASISACVLHAHTLKPFDEEAVLTLAAGRQLVVTVEEHSAIGGLGSAVCDLLAQSALAVPVLKLALADGFSHEYGSQDHILEVARLTPPHIAERVSDALRAAHRRVRAVL
ncbi:MAG: transketolase [Candidatus Eremiobacteraeota bacterium]|nr:transketolase [Candidatus Eremiobacteraeota bacterium]